MRPELQIPGVQTTDPGVQATGSGVQTMTQYELTRAFAVQAYTTVQRYKLPRNFRKNVKRFIWFDLRNFLDQN